MTTITSRAASVLGLVGNLASLILALSTNDPFWSWAGLIAHGGLMTTDWDNMESPQ
jgi:hypothetical protein